MQNYILELFIAFKMAYYCYFSLGGNIDCPAFHPKKFYNIDYWYFWWTRLKSGLKLQKPS